MSLLFEALQRVEGERAGFGSPPSPDAAELLQYVEGTGSPHSPSRGPGDAIRISEAPAPSDNTVLAALGRARSNGEPSPKHLSGLRRSMSVLQTALPLVESLLLLFDAKKDPAVSTLAASQPLAPPADPLPQSLALAPIEQGFDKLRIQTLDLRDQLVEHDASVKRIDDHLERVREATDRNTLEQQELIEDLKGLGGKVKLVSLLAIGLLAISVAINLALYLHFLQIGR